MGNAISVPVIDSPIDAASEPRMQQKLPDELLVEIAKGCVEPWTLKINGLEMGGLWSGRRPKLDGYPKVANTKLANTLFDEEITKAIIAKFDGCVVVVSSQIKVNRAFERGSRMVRLAPHIKKVIVQVHDSMWDSVGDNLGRLTGLRELVLDIRRAHDIGSAIGRLYPRSLMQATRAGHRSITRASIIFNALLNNFRTRSIMRTLLDRKVKLTVRFRCTTSWWHGNVVVQFELDDNRRPKFASYAFDR